MSDKALIWSLVAVPLLGLGWLALAPTTERVPEPESRRPTPVAAAPETEPETYSDPTPSLPDEAQPAPVEPQSEVSAEVAADENGDAQERGLAPAPLDAEDRAMRGQEETLLAARWTRESPDPSWSIETEGLTEDLLRDAELPPSAVSNVDCKETICRLELSAPGGPEALKAIRVARKIHDETWVDHQQRDDGSYHVNVYFSRTGYRLSGGGGPIEG